MRDEKKGIRIPDGVVDLYAIAFTGVLVARRASRWLGWPPALDHSSQ